MKEGDSIQVKTKESTFTGIYMPSGSKTLNLKLKDGYNLSILKEKIVSKKLIKKATIKKATKSSTKLKSNPKLKNVMILHTGGTIASKVDYKTGGVVSKFTPQEIISMYPELKDVVNIDARLVGNMWSEDLRFAHYNLLAKEVAKEAKKRDGIIITQGTDTLAITAAALSFILEGINIPVILVGSQRSSDRGSSDAGMNLIKASEFISKTSFVGVAICMHETSQDSSCAILPPCKTRKMHSSRRNAFQVINGKPIARVSNKIEYLAHYIKKDPKRKLTVKQIKETLKIGILKAHTNMFSQEIKMYENFNGLILEGFGIGGHFPINKTDDLNKHHNSISSELKKLAKKIPVVSTTTCLFGRVNMNVYTTGRKMKEFNILGNHLDMLPETAFIKLAWLLSNHKKDLKELFSKNLRGEISKRTEFSEEFI
jgi:glutamyl-tRNA(Gln) amidotransferase subunit D